MKALDGKNLLASVCLLSPRAPLLVGWFCPPHCLLSCLVLLAFPLLVGLAFSFVFGAFSARMALCLSVFCSFLSLRPYHDEMTQVVTSCMNLPMNWWPVIPLWVGFCFSFCVVLVLCFFLVMTAFDFLPLPFFGWVGLVFILDFQVFACCNALQVLCWDEDTLGAPEDFCRYFSAWRLRDNACFDDEFAATASMSLGTTIRCWPCLIVPETFSLLTWHGGHVHHETHQKF